jgi:hypoxanthine phosphoribosyltransferase
MEERHLADLESGLAEILISDRQIQQRVKELGEEITRAYRGKHPYLVVILNGAFMFIADLVRHIDLDLEVGFIAVSSYGDSTHSTGTVRIVKDLQKDILDRHVILVEDIVDTGLTISYLREMLTGRKPASIATVSLLSKPDARKVQVPLEYCGFEIPNKFVIGYGLDFSQKFRNLPCIGVLDPAGTKPAKKD